MDDGCRYLTNNKPELNPHLLLVELTMDIGWLIASFTTMMLS